MGLFDDEPEAGAGAGTGLMGQSMGMAVREAQVVVKALPGTTLESIPAPYTVAGQGELSPDEEADFAACQAGVRNLHTAFWVAGKALETIKSGNLQRRVHTNFAQYVWEAFEISEPQMHRLMGEWRVGEALSQLGWKPRESQVRELTSIADEAGVQAAVAVYDTVARSTKRVTAQILKDVAAQLPPLKSASPTQVREMVATVIAPPVPRASPELLAGTEGTPASEPLGGASGRGAAAESSVADTERAGTEGKPSVSGEQLVAVEAAVGPETVTSDAGNESKTPAPLSPVEHPDVKNLIAAANLLKQAQRMLSSSAVRRAGEAHPEFTADLIMQMRASGDRIGAALDVSGGQQQ
ncbi:hypothetical protein ACFQ71_36350 [Streptomyces sp. NPDC056534]|uniref:hypothetical protein n=1 Tax=Streptomyces sp. NPDC056534 TaxID=3345857 RepID=UPI0036892401